MDKRIRRFICDSQFYPHLEKVLNRLPEKAKNETLDNKDLQIIGSEDFVMGYGLYFWFDEPVERIIYLNPRILKTPENVTIHTIAHELAHHFAREGRTGLYEKEAEELLEKWGFGKEVEKIKYDKPILESRGYELGYEWARKQNDHDLLDRFDEYFDEWNERRTSTERWKQLHYDVDPSSIIRQMGAIQEEKPEDGDPKKDYLFDDGLLEKSIVWGVMGRVKEIKQEKKTHDYETEAAEVIETLEKIRNEVSKLFSLNAFHRYSELAHEMGITKEFIKLDEFLEHIKKSEEKAR